MRLRTWIGLWSLIAGLLLLLPGMGGAQGSQTVPSIELSGTVDPATEAWVGSALEQAAEDDAPLAIIRLDTPGGLESSMREIVQDILEAPMPVVVYVGAERRPSGVRRARSSPRPRTSPRWRRRPTSARRARSSPTARTSAAPSG